MKNNQYAKGRASAFKECFDAMEEILEDSETYVKHVNSQGEVSKYYKEDALYDYMRSLLVLRIDEESKIQGGSHAKKKEA